MSDQTNDPAARLSQETINEFVVASHFDFPKVQSMLAEQPALLNENAEWIETPIQAAAHVNNREIAEWLLAQGAPLDICTATMLNRADDVHAMLEEDPEMIDDTGAHNIPLMYFAVLSDNPELAAFLAEKGAAINSEEGTNSALHGAALFGRTVMARWLLEHDANPYALDYEGKTPLDRARSKGYTEIEALLTPFFPDDRQG